MTGNSGPFTGSDCLFQGLYRHGYFKNRHGYFPNPSVCPRIGKMMPISCPEKTAFGTVWAGGNPENGLRDAGTGRTGVLDRTRIRSSLSSHGGLREKKPSTGSVYLPGRPDRHGFSKNRHGYFSNPSVCARIGGLMPLACPKKAAFGTVWAGDNSENGLQVVAGVGAGKPGSPPGSPPYRREEDRTHPGHRTGWTNDEYKSETGGI
jgi:hypothetical protein